MVLVSTQANASSETWVQNLDLTIPSSEMPLTWHLDSRVKQEIMMGFECCWDKKLISAVQTEALEMSIQSKLKEKQIIFGSIPYSLPPTENQIILFQVLNVLDLALTIHGLKHPNIIERNPIVGEKPSDLTLILYKATLAPIILDHFDSQQLQIVNTALGLAVLNNINVINRYNAW